MIVTTHCCICGDVFDLEFDPHDITEGGGVKTHMVEAEMFARRDFARCSNGHQDPAAFIVGAIHDHLAEIHWDAWENEERYQAETRGLGGEASETVIRAGAIQGSGVESGQPGRAPSSVTRRLAKPCCGSTRGGGAPLTLAPPLEVV